MAEHRQDSVAQAAAVIGDAWMLQVVGEAFRGTRRFGEFREALGISRNVLTSRLRKLVRHGIFELHPYQEQPRREEYRLTAKGRDLLPIMLTVMRWGDVYRPDGIAPDSLAHTACGGHPIHAEVTCSSCGSPILANEVQLVGAADTDPAPEPLVESPDAVYISIEIVP